MTFYLNYVGCKDHFGRTPNHCTFRFTLTMWDVKNLAEIQDKVARASFTLTMWDVKSNTEIMHITE